ncbi:MAG: hypothetical protein CL445_07500 [Acidimicrobiaceae bacterium]|nr:hypothetical protein [Acidimicrobiaceae bacterium]
MNWCGGRITSTASTEVIGDLPRPHLPCNGSRTESFSSLAIDINSSTSAIPTSLGGDEVEWPQA